MRGRRVNSKTFDESPSVAKEALLDFKKLFRKDVKSRNLSREDTKCKGEETPVSQGSDIVHGESVIEDEPSLDEGSREDLQDEVCETAEEAQETPPEVSGDQTQKESTPILTREPALVPRTSLEPTFRSSSLEGVKKSSKFRLKDHLSKLDARVRRAFSWEHSQNELPGSLVVHDPEIKLNLPNEDENSPQDETPETPEPRERLGVQTVPLLTCSPSTSVSSSPAASPRITPRPSPLEEKSLHFKSDEEGETKTPEVDPKSSLGLFDNEGNPIPPIRRRMKTGDEEKRKVSQTSSSPSHGGECVSRDVTPSKGLGGSVTPTAADDGTQPSTGVSSPSNIGAFKTFISHIGKKGSSQGLVGTSCNRLGPFVHKCSSKGCACVAEINGGRKKSLEVWVNL